MFDISKLKDTADSVAEGRMKDGVKGAKKKATKKNAAARKKVAEKTKKPAFGKKFPKFLKGPKNDKMKADGKGGSGKKDC